jgi:hypothetical protein
MQTLLELINHISTTIALVMVAMPSGLTLVIDIGIAF